jgi:hypothetical protein
MHTRGTVRYSIVQCNAAQYSTIQRGTVQSSPMQWSNESIVQCSSRFRVKNKFSMVSSKITISTFGPSL